MTKIAEQAPALKGLTSGLHEREMSTLFTYQTLHEENRKKGTNNRKAHVSGLLNLLILANT